MHSTCSCIISLGLCSLCIQIAPYQMSAFIVHTFFFLPFSIEHFHANFSFFRCWDYSGGLGFFCLPFTLNTTWPKQSLSFQVYVLKRPHVDEFLQRMGELFECVLFTASLAKVCSSLHPINPYDAGLWVGFSMDNYFCSLALS